MNNSDTSIQDLRTQRNTLLTLFENAPGLLLLVDNEGKIRLVNRAVTEMAETTQDKLMGLLGGEVFRCVNSANSGCGKNEACKDCPVRSRVLKSFQTSEKIINEEGSLIVNVGGNTQEQRYFLISTVPMRFDNEELVLVAINDITERKRVEQELHKNQEFVRALLESVSEGVIACDAEGNLALFNKTAREWHGLDATAIPSEEWAGRYDLFDSDGKTPLKTEAIPLARAFAGEVVKDGEMSIVPKGQSPRFVLANSCAFFDSQGKKLGAVVVMRDVTESKLTKKEKTALETELHQVHKMEALGQLAGGIAHDFNNQLSVIMGYGEMLQHKNKDVKLDKQIIHILGAAEKSANLVRQLLAFSRKGEYTVKPLDVNEMLLESMAVLDRSIDKKIKLKKGFNTIDTMIMGDPSLLQNAFLNLSLNARDAMPDGGILTFSTDVVKLKDKEGNLADYVRISIQDTGHGMSEEVKQHLFEPFFTTKGVGKGTGLGLASVYGTIKRHNGEIEVESKIGSGTTFIIYLPITEQNETNQSIRDSKTYPNAIKTSIRVLIVDDEKNVLELATDMLTDLGYSVVCKEDGLLATEYYHSHWGKIDVVILDMNMPNMNGAETFVAMRKINPKAKILIASGYNKEGVQQLLKYSGAEHITKPYHINEIIQKIEKMMKTA